MKSFNQFESTEEITHIKEQRLLAIQQQLDEIVGAGVKILKGIGKIGGKGGKAGSKLPSRVPPGAANQVTKQPGAIRSILTYLGLDAGLGLAGSGINTLMQQGGFQGAVDPRALRNAYLKSQELKAMSYRQDKDKKKSSGDKKPGRTGIAGLRDARST